jgi:hypothetical protein
MQNGLETDRLKFEQKERDYFTISIKNAAGAQQIRTFDWHAQGY